VRVWSKFYWLRNESSGGGGGGLLKGGGGSCQYYWYYYCVKWVLCDHGMARPQVGDGGDGFFFRNALNSGWMSSQGMTWKV